MTKRAVQAGFTLIELIVVMVIIGILAAIAIPQFSDVETNAKDAVANGVCAALHSQAVIRYASAKKAASFSDLTALLNPGLTGGTAAYGTTCGTPTVQWTPTGQTPGSVVTCAAIPAALCTP